MANVTGWFAEISASITVPQMIAGAVMTAPQVTTNSAITLAPPRMSATAVMKPIAVGLSTTLTAPRMSASAALTVPVLSNAFNVSLTAPRMAATATLAVPGVTVSGDITAPRMAATAAMATPVVATINGSSYSDNFNRSDSASLGATWTTDLAFGALAIASNAAVTDGSGVGGGIYATAMTTGNNQLTVVMKGTPTAGDNVFLVARSNNASSSNSATKLVLLSMVQGSQWTLYRNQSDSTGVSSAGSQSWAAGDTIDFSCVGATLTVKRNGSTILTTGGATDLAAGYVEIAVIAAGAGIGFDSFTAQDI